jgi:hypothetical protein
MAAPRTMRWSKYIASIIKIENSCIFLATNHLGAKDLDAVMTIARRFNSL